MMSDRKESLVPARKEGKSAPETPRRCIHISHSPLSHWDLLHGSAIDQTVTSRSLPLLSYCVYLHFITKMSSQYQSGLGGLLEPECRSEKQGMR